MLSEIDATFRHGTRVTVFCWYYPLGRTRPDLRTLQTYCGVFRNANWRGVLVNRDTCGPRRFGWDDLAGVCDTDCVNDGHGRWCRDHRKAANRYLIEHGLPPIYGREG
jgi:hypothetical protein